LKGTENESIEASFVYLKVYDLLGNEVATLVNEEQSEEHTEQTLSQIFSLVVSMLPS